MLLAVVTLSRRDMGAASGSEVRESTGATSEMRGRATML